jgi:SH3 domain
MERAELLCNTLLKWYQDLSSMLVKRCTKGNNSQAASTIYIALYDYEAQTDEELSLKAQDHLEILDKSEVRRTNT